MDEAFEGMHDFCKVVDDMVAFDSDPHVHVRHVRQLLQCYQEKSISLNREKLSSARLRFSSLASSLYQKATQLARK